MRGPLMAKEENLIDLTLHVALGDTFGTMHVLPRLGWYWWMIPPEELMFGAFPSRILHVYMAIYLSRLRSSEKLFRSFS